MVVLFWFVYDIYSCIYAILYVLLFLRVYNDGMGSSVYEVVCVKAFSTALPVPQISHLKKLQNLVF